MIDDSDLLRRYAETRSEEAFAQIVRRHVDRVYSVALRQVGGDRQLAEDAVQTVFTSLARKASLVAKRPVLGGWLYRTTQYAAADLVRSERRRRARQEAAHFMQQNSASEGSDDWEKVRPILNESLSQLGDCDRDAVWLRFFEGRAFSEIGNQLRLTENAARMRVDRALAKLHAALARRGVTSTTTALAAVLTNQTLVAAPSGLASTIAGTAMTSAGMTGFWSAATFMSLTKLQIGITGAVLVAGTSGLAYLYHTNSTLNAEINALQAENHTLATQQRDTRYPLATAADAESRQNGDVEAQRLKEAAAALRQKQRQAPASQAAIPQNLSSPERLSAGAEPAPGKEDLVPIAKTQVIAVYPEALKAARVPGQVLVSFIVDSNGQVHNAVAKESTRSEFEAPAVEAVSQWTFESGRKGGRQVNTRMEVPIAFSPENEGTPSSAARPAGS